ncbi:MAG: hypothetical protein NVSMB62_08770 [Acidobacteriaceae bacterium]
MRVSINLATRPFVELRPLFARLRIAMAALTVLAIGLGFWAHSLSGRARDAQSRIDALHAQTLSLQTERQANERRMQQPSNRAVLERSRFLNGVFERKGFSWTAVMMDLERVLPAGVQVTSIEPVVTADGEVNIRLRVSGQRERAVELVRNLERSQRFLQPRLANEAAQTQDNGRTVAVVQTTSTPGAVEFDVLSGYNPLPATGILASPDGTTQPGPPHRSSGARHKSSKLSAPIDTRGEPR